MRIAKAKGGYSFSRASAARASLGTTSYAWFDAVDRLEADPAADVQSSTTWPRGNKLTLLGNDDLILEYDKGLLKGAKIIYCEGPINLEESGYFFQAVFDNNTK